MEGTLCVRDGRVKVEGGGFSFSGGGCRCVGGRRSFLAVGLVFRRSRNTAVDATGDVDTIEMRAMA